MQISKAYVWIYYTAKFHDLEISATKMRAVAI